MNISGKICSELKLFVSYSIDCFLLLTFGKKRTERRFFSCNRSIDCVITSFFYSFCAPIECVGILFNQCRLRTDEIQCAAHSLVNTKYSSSSNNRRSHHKHPIWSFFFSFFHCCCSILSRSNRSNRPMHRYANDKVNASEREMFWNGFVFQ